MSYSDFGLVVFQGTMRGLPVTIIRERTGWCPFLVYVSDRFEGAEYSLNAAQDRASSITDSLTKNRSQP